jgi:hypothetical protein
MTAKGLRLTRGLPFDSWAELGNRIAEISDASAWWLGDWLVYGQQAYGDRYRVALEATTLDYQTLRNYAWVARRFEMSRRRDGLSLQHHAEVAALPDAGQDLWLRRAERFGWSRNELRRQMSETRRLQKPGKSRARKGARDDSAITCRVRVPVERAERWREAATMSEQELPDWIVSVADTAADSALEARAGGQVGTAVRNSQ